MNALHLFQIKAVLLELEFRKGNVTSFQLYLGILTHHLFVQKFELGKPRSNFLRKGNHVFRGYLGRIAETIFQHNAEIITVVPVYFLLNLFILYF